MRDPQQCGQSQFHVIGFTFDNQNREDPVGRASQDANRVAPTQRRNSKHPSADRDPPLSTETTDQDRLFDLKFNEEGLREQWLPTHHCSREY